MHLMAAEPHPELRIDDLAHQSGVPTTTIRLYQNRGLLPGPRLEGRVGWYDQGHLDRLALIGRLRDEGHSLAGIKRLVDSWEEGAGLEDLVGMEAGLAALLGGNRSVTLTLAQLADRLPLDAMDPDTLSLATESGLVELTDDGQVRIPDPRFLELGPTLAALGVSSATIVREWAELSQHTDRIAEQFGDLFERELVPADASMDLNPDEVRDLAEQLTTLHRLAGLSVQAALDASLARVARDRFSALAAALVEGEPQST